MNKKSKYQTKYKSLAIPVELHKRLKSYTQKEGLKIRFVIEAIIESFLESDNEKDNERI